MRRVLGIGLLLSLVLAAPAPAKEVISAKVCGASGCASSRDRDLIAPLAEGGDVVDPPAAAAPFFRVRLAVGEEDGKVIERFWTHFVPRGELIRGSDGTWMRATDAYTNALKKVVDPSLESYPAARLAELLAGDRPAPPPAGGTGAATIAALAAGGGVSAALLVLLVLRVRSATSGAARAGGP